MCDMRSWLPSRAVMKNFFRERPAIGEAVTPFGRDRINLVLVLLTILLFWSARIAAMTALIGFWLVTVLETRRRGIDRP